MPANSAKRALIVDDSRSARAFLSRILEKYLIEVETAESAECAIEYLASHRPDVIFMDHLMPGMDGFQAVQAIKNNPATAGIPIMMYTSEEGELYVGQARALGAAGVLPKQIKPADVSKVLYELHLVPERRSGATGAFRPVLVGSLPDAPAELPGANVSPGILQPRSLTDVALREQFAELRRTLVASLDTQSGRLAADLRCAIADALPPSPHPREPISRTSPWGWVVAVITVLAIIAGGMEWRRQDQVLENTRVRVAELERVLAAERAAAAVAAADAVMEFSYGAEPLAGERLERVRSTLQRLAAARVPGTFELSVGAGRFCLAGNAAAGFALMAEETLAAQCEHVGNPAHEEFARAALVPLELATLAERLRRESGGALAFRVMQDGAERLAVPYPRDVGAVTAGEWNRAARANNRVETRFVR